MMDTLVSLMFMEDLEEVIEQGLPLRAGNQSRVGPTGMYHTKDGDVFITVASDEQWGRLCRAFKVTALADDPRFRDHGSRMAHADDARGEVQRLLGQLSRREALELLERSDVPCAPVRTAAEVMADPSCWKRGSLRPLRHGTLSGPAPGVGSGFPVLFSGELLPETPGAPTLGMHNEEILRGLLGISPEELQQLQQRGIV